MIRLEKGKWYSANGAKYLIGGWACAGNLYVIKVYKNKRVSALDCIYSWQEDNFKMLTRGIPKLSDKYNKRIALLMKGGLGLTGQLE
jgi:hypothetical protein